MQLQNGTIDLIFDKVRDGIVVARIESRRFIMCNSTMAAMLGYSRDELLAIGVDDIHTQDSLPRVLKLFDRMAKGESTLANDVPVKRKDGSVFYADINAVPLEIEGTPCVAGTFRDATERREAAAKLGRQMSLLESLVRISEAASVLDCDEFIDFMLKDAGTTLGADRAILYVSQGEWKARALHLWAANPSFKSKAVDVKIEDLGPSIKKLQDEGYVLLKRGEQGLTRGMADVFERASAQSILITGLEFKGRTMGSIVVTDCTRPRVLDEGQIRYLKSVSKITSLCLEGSMARNSMQERLVRAETLSKIAVEFMGKKPFSEKAEYLLSSLAMLLDCPRTYFFRKGAGNAWSMEIYHGPKTLRSIKDLDGKDFPEIISRLEKKEFAIIPPASACKNEKLKKLFIPPNSKGGIAVPVFVRGRLYGALGFGFSKEGGWKEEHLSILSTAADLLGHLAESES